MSGTSGETRATAQPAIGATRPIRVANAPCSWGILELDPRERSASFEQVLDEITASGYEGTELGDWGFLPTDPSRLAHELAYRNLALVAGFVPVRFWDGRCHDAGERAALDTAALVAAVGGPHAIVVLSDENGASAARVQHAGRIRSEHALGRDEWEMFARGVERVARAVRDTTGLRVAFHAHCAGYVETADELDCLLERTDPALVGVCLDTGHLTYAGADPVEVLRRHGSRVRHAHFKDCDPVVAREARTAGWDYFTAIRAGLFCELGRGSVPFAAVVSALRDVGYRGWIVVEQDVLPGQGTPLASARRNREYLRGIGL